MRRDITIFISYAHEDEQLCIELQKHLCLLQRVKDVKLWSDRNIAAGAEWEQEMSHYLDTAQIILLLISADFMASDHCYSVEMKRALERHEAGEAHVIPIIIRPVFWKIAPFAKLQALPPDGEPVTSKNQDEAFSEIAQGILNIVEGKIQQPGSASISDGHRVDLGEAPDVVNFYGREEELATLKSWIVDNRSKLVVVSGAGGIGKTSLVLIFEEQIKDQFEYVFWRSLQRKPSLKGVPTFLPPKIPAKDLWD